MSDTSERVEDLVDLSGRPPCWPAPAVELWRRAAAHADATAGASVPPAAGLGALRRALATRLELDADRLVVLPSVRFAAILLALGHRSIVLEWPTFLGVREVLTRAGVSVADASWPTMNAAAKRHSASALWFTSPLRNPDGATMDLAHAVIDGGLTTVQNETYAWWAAAHVRHPHAILVGSLSKLVGPAKRLAYAYFPDGWDAYRPLLRAVRLPLSFQAAWAEFVESGGIDALVGAAVTATRVARTAFVARLDGAVSAALDEPAAPFLVLRLPSCLSEEEALEHLRRRGVLVNPGSGFACDSPSIRVAFTGVDPSAASRAGAIVRALLAE